MIDKNYFCHMHTESTSLAGDKYNKLVKCVYFYEYIHKLTLLNMHAAAGAH